MLELAAPTTEARDPPSPHLYAAYNEGASALARGALVTACPYPKDSAKRDAWESGWFDFSHAVEMLPDD